MSGTGPGVDALSDAPRSGRPKTVDEAEIVARTLEPPPERLGVSHTVREVIVALVQRIYSSLEPGRELPDTLRPVERRTAAPSDSTRPWTER